MNPSHLQQLINDKETELSKIRSLANVALQREREIKEETQRIVSEMGREMERIKMESEQTVKRVTQQLESESDGRIHLAMEEMAKYLERRQNEIYADVSSQMERDWQKREYSLKEDVKLLLETELKRQHDQLSAHYEEIVHRKECNTKLIQEDMKQQLAQVDERHQSEIKTMKKKMEDLANDVWNEARIRFATAANEETTYTLATAQSQCKELLDENLELRRMLKEKDSEVRDLIREIKEAEDEFKAVAAGVNRMHAKDMDEMSDEVTRLRYHNDRLQKAVHEIGSDSDRLRDELDQKKQILQTLEVKYDHQKRLLDTVDDGKNECSRRNNELKACNDLLERQMMELSGENKRLMADNEKQRIIINEISSENENQSTTIIELRQAIKSNEAKCTNLEQKNEKASNQIASLEQERHTYSMQLKQLIEQKDRHYSETSTVYEKKLHTAQNDLSILSSECNELRSRILQLQREKFRLEHDLMLMDAQQKNQRHNNNEENIAKLEDTNQEAGKLNDENKALKEIINMMRMEMESVVSDDPPAESSMERILERQLSLCRSYLDLLLNVSNKRLTKYDELKFLRSKNRELLQVVDELRNESLLTEASQTQRSQNNKDHVTSMQEQHLISRLEEATDEIDTLLQERDQLMSLSNQLKFELHQANKMVQRRSSTRHVKIRKHESRAPQEDEADDQILDAILNDFSASYDGGGSHEESEVACIGMKPPTGKTNVHTSRPITASDRATSSQQKSYQRMLQGIKKKQTALQSEKVKVRNWGIKDSLP